MKDWIAFIGDIHGEARVLDRALFCVEDIGVAVSYTHLTLPTKA